MAYTSQYPRASQTFNPYMSYTAPRPISNGRQRSRMGSREGSRQGSRPGSRVGSRVGSRQSNRALSRTLRPAQVPVRQSYYSQPTAGACLSGWGEVTAKPHGYEIDNYKQTSAYARPELIRAAGGYAQKQWAPALARNTTRCGLVLRDTNTLHTSGAGVMVEAVMPNSQSAWNGFKAKDIITHVNNRETTTVNDFYDAYSIGGSLAMRLNRDGVRGKRMN